MVKKMNAAPNSTSSIANKSNGDTKIASDGSVSKPVDDITNKDKSGEELDANVTKEEERKDAVQKERLGRLVKKEGKDAVQRRPRKIAQNSRSLKQIKNRSPKRSACLK